MEEIDELKKEIRKLREKQAISDKKIVEVMKKKGVLGIDSSYVF